MTLRYVFLDDGGTINDNARREPQWRRLVGEFFAPHLGGEASVWSEANRRSFAPVFERFTRRVAAWDDARSDYRRELELYGLDWLGSMAAEIGVELPPGEAGRLVLVAAANAYIAPRVRADYRGAVEAIRALAADFTLFTSSGTASHELALILGALDVADLFARLYGPDLVNTPKGHVRFYARLFADAGVDPTACLVLDDTAESLLAARAAGARVVLISEAPTDELPRIAALRDLPALLSASDP